MRTSLKVALLLGMLVAIPTWLSAAQTDKKDVRAGNRAYKKGEYRDAEESYRRALDKVPASAIAQYNLANAIYKQIDSTTAQSEEGKERIQKVHELYQKSAETFTTDKHKAAAQYNEGNTYLDEQNWDAAIESYKKSLRLNPDDMEAKQNLVFAQAMKRKQQQQQQQNQNNKDKKDKNKDKDKDKQKQNQDQNKDNKDKNQDKQDQQQNQNNNDKQNQQQQQPQGGQKISKEDAQRMLQALEQQEKNTQEKVKKEKALKAQQRNIDKNW